MKRLRKIISAIILATLMAGSVSPVPGIATMAEAAAKTAKIQGLDFKYSSLNTGKLTWKKAAVKYYRVRRRTYSRYIDDSGSFSKTVEKKGKWQSLGKLWQSTTSLKVSSAQTGTSYQYEVRGYNKSGKLTHKDSMIVYYRLAQMRSVFIEEEKTGDDGKGEVLLCAYDEAGGFGDGYLHSDDFEWQRKVKGGSYKAIGKTHGNYFKDSGLATHTTYVWRVRGIKKLGSKTLRTNWKTLSHTVANPIAKLSVKLISHEAEDTGENGEQAGRFIYSVTSDEDNGDFVFSGDMYLGHDDGCDEQILLYATTGSYGYDGLEHDPEGYTHGGLEFTPIPDGGLIIHPGQTFYFDMSYQDHGNHGPIADPMKRSWRFWGKYNDISHVFFLNFEKGTGFSTNSEDYYC